MRRPSRLSQAGFTLVELMIVVAIVGILARVAMVRFERFKQNAMGTEALISLSSLYTMERTFQLENGSFTVCLRAIGFQVDNRTRQIFGVGFGMDGGTPGTCGPNGNQHCGMAGWPNAGGLPCTPLLPADAFSHTVSPPTVSLLGFPINGGYYSGAIADLADSLLPGPQISQLTFVGSAVGFFEQHPPPCPPFDYNNNGMCGVSVWYTVDQDKRLSKQR